MAILLAGLSLGGVSMADREFMDWNNSTALNFTDHHEHTQN